MYGNATLPLESTSYVRSFVQKFRFCSKSICYTARLSLWLYVRGHLKEINSRLINHTYQLEYHGHDLLWQLPQKGRNSSTTTPADQQRPHETPQPLEPSCLSSHHWQNAGHTS